MGRGGHGERVLCDRSDVSHGEDGPSNSQGRGSIIFSFPETPNDAGCAEAALAGGRQQAAGPLEQGTLTRLAEPCSLPPGRSAPPQAEAVPGGGERAEGYSPLPSAASRSLVTCCRVLLGDFHGVFQHLRLK